MENDYIPVRSRNIGGRMAGGWLSPAPDDFAWDNFLQATSLGRYEQSTLWAQAKRCEGWRPIRIVLTLDGQIAGGVQILARQTTFGDVGFIDRGPVVVPEEPALFGFLTELLLLTAETENLQGLLIQPPDKSKIDDGLWARHRFLPNDIVKLDSATLLLELTLGMEAIKRGMRKTVREAIRQSERRGIRVREGGEQDIATFFALLVASCRRQQKKPRPATEMDLLRVWNAFHPSGCARLSIAEYEGEIIAGSFNLCFGERVTGWRKVWSGAHREKHPNHALIFEVIEWAQGRGYKVFDFGGIDRDIAIALLRGEPLLDRQKAAKDFVHLGYGGTPLLTPFSRVYISHPLLRFAYQTGGLGGVVKRLQSWFPIAI